MKKLVGAITVLVCIVIAGLLWIDTAFALPDANCRCIEPQNASDQCDLYCEGHGFCGMYAFDPEGTCVDQACYTYFTFWCYEGGMGRSISVSDNCPDCWEEPPY